MKLFFFDGINLSENYHKQKNNDYIHNNFINCNNNNNFDEYFIPKSTRNKFINNNFKNTK